MVNPKSGTSFDREMNSTIGITLLENIVSRRGAPGRRIGKARPDKSNEQPNQPQGPSNCAVASNTLPVKDKVEGEGLPGDQRREKDQDDSGDIIHKLQQDDAANNFQRGEFSERAC